MRPRWRSVGRRRSAPHLLAGRSAAEDGSQATLLLREECRRSRQGKKVDRRHCGIGGRGAAGLRPDQPIEEVAWSARLDRGVSRRRWPIRRLPHWTGTSSTASRTRVRPMKGERRRGRVDERRLRDSPLWCWRAASPIGLRSRTGFDVGSSSLVDSRLTASSCQQTTRAAYASLALPPLRCSALKRAPCRLVQRARPQPTSSRERTR